MGTDGFQEADVCAITQCTTKASILVTDPAQTLHQSARSVRARAQRPPGPGAGRHSDRRPQSALRSRADSPPRKVNDVKPVADRRQRSRPRRTRFATRTGRWRSPAAACAIRKAVKAFRELCALLRIAAHDDDLRARCVRSRTTSHGLGMLGMHGTKASNLTVHTADVVLAFGMRFDDRVTGRPDRFATRPRSCTTTSTPREFNKIIPTHVMLHGDSADTINALIAELQDRSRAALRRLGRCRRKRSAVRCPATSRKTATSRRPTSSIALRGDAAEDAIVTTDVGQHQMWTAQRFKPNTPRDFCHLGRLGLDGLRLSGGGRRVLRQSRAAGVRDLSATAASR